VAAAEHGIALMCALSRNVAQADASMKTGKWERTKYVGVSLVDKTLAIMGFGKVRPLVCGGGAGGVHCQGTSLRGGSKSPWASV
jgi:D-3-phosphoglycerate dehydrogenase